MTDMFRKYGIFFIVPGIVFIFSVLLKIAAGPYWLATNLDPAYQYLVNGVYLIKGIVPNHTDHPGTPLQMLCCAVSWLLNIGRPAEDVVTHVLKAPEFYLHAVFTALSLFSLLSSFGLAVYVFRKTNDRWAALLTQLPTLSFLVLKSWETAEPVLPVVANVSPETMLIGIINLFNICLLMNFFARTPADELISVLWWGLVCGLGMAVKLTFIPLLAVPLIVLSWKNKIIFVGMVAASFVLWTLPIISKYPIIWGWISGIAMHQGAHGSGGQGIEIFSYWINIIIEQAGFVILLLAAVVVAIQKFVAKKWDRSALFLIAIVTGVVLQFSAVTQHPGAHYLLPGLGLFSVILVLFYMQDIAYHPLARRMTIGFILIGILSGAWQTNAYRLKLEGLTRDMLSFHDHVAAAHPDCIFVNYYRSSDQEAALFFGDGWSEAPQLGKELFRLYPNKFYFHIWENNTVDFNGRVWLNDLLAQDSCVLFQGDGQFDFSKGPDSFTLLEKGRFESIEMLRGTTEKQAATLLAGALHFLQAGDYARARACALQARKFHYQPDSTVESILKLSGSSAAQ